MPVVNQINRWEVELDFVVSGKYWEDNILTQRFVAWLGAGGGAAMGGAGGHATGVAIGTGTQGAAAWLLGGKGKAAGAKMGVVFGPAGMIIGGAGGAALGYAGGKLLIEPIEHEAVYYSYWTVRCRCIADGIAEFDPPVFAIFFERRQEPVRRDDGPLAWRR